MRKKRMMKWLGIYAGILVCAFTQQAVFAEENEEVSVNDEVIVEEAVIDEETVQNAAPYGTFTLSVMSYNLQSTENAQAMIRQVASAVYDYLAQF